MNQREDFSEFVEEDDEFGGPDEVVDRNGQISHAFAYLTDAIAKASLRVGQHAAEIDHLKQRLAHVIAERDGYKTAYEQITDKINAGNSAGQPLPVELQNVELDPDAFDVLSVSKGSSYPTSQPETP